MKVDKRDARFAKYSYNGMEVSGVRVVATN
jgi:hypothetical protein